MLKLIMKNEKTGSQWWEIADWSLGNTAIAKIFKLNKSVVARRRKKLKLPNSSKIGCPKGTKRTQDFKNKISKAQKGKSSPKKVRDIDHEWSSFRNKPNKSFKIAVKEVYGEACEICNYLKPEISNHVHHIIPKSKGGKHTIRNSCVLCSRCHDEVHAGILQLSNLIVSRLSGV